jgi:4-amino-4-deoxy-L-arabinose transferase-like glycosyltransferase
LLALVGVGGLALRVWVYRALAVPDSDEAVTGLMARHILHGEFPVFFWGQGYGGSQEAFLTAPLFLVAGSSWLTLRLVPIALTVVAAFLVWRVGRLTIGEPAATAAAALFWIWPPFAIAHTTRQYGFYGSGLVYCAALLLLALRLVELPSRSRAGVFGLVLGLAFWQTSQIVPVAVGVVAWAILKKPAWLRHVWLAAAAFALGALPWIVWNLEHRWGSLHPKVGGSSTYEHRLRIFFSPVLPMMLGLRSTFTQQLTLPAAATYLLYAVLAGLFGYGAYRLRRRNSSILYLVAAVFPFVWALSPLTFIEYEPRYLVIFTPVLVLLVAQLMTTWGRAAVVLAAAAALSVVFLHRMETLPPDLNGVTEARGLAPLVSVLDRLGLHRVYAEYWASYVLDFDTRERIVAAENKFTSVRFVDGRPVLPDDPFVRYPRYQDEVKAAPDGFVFFRGNSIPILPALVRHGYRAYPVGQYVVYAVPPRHA